RADVRPFARGADRVGLDPAEQRGDLGDPRAALVAAGEAETGRPEHAAVGLEHQHVIGQLTAIAFEIAQPAAAAVLLVGPQDDPQRAPRPQVQLLHQPQRLPAHHAPAAIVGRAAADVPGIEVAADNHDFLGPLTAADL